MNEAARRRVLVLVAVLTFGCGLVAYGAYEILYSTILESNALFHLKAEEIPGSHPTRLRVLGSPTYSGAVVHCVAQKKRGSTLVVLMHLAPAGWAKQMFYGEMINYEVTVPDSVNEVRFGRNATLLWKRSVSAP